MDFKTRYHYNPKTDLLGRGACATVFKAADSLLNRTVAVKFLKKGNYHKDILGAAINHAMALQHPNLCRLYDTAVLRFENMHGETEETDICIFEYLAGGNLKDHIAGDPQHLNKLLLDVLQGLAFLHEQGITHGSLKHANILVETTGDLPVAKITEHVVEAYVASTLPRGFILNIAPERFNPAIYGIDGKVSTNLDFWYFGLLVYELLTGDRMFGSRGGQNSAEDVINSILSDEFVKNKIIPVPQPYRQVVARCLVAHAGNRAQSADELIALLQQGYAETEPARIKHNVAQQHTNDFKTRYPYNPETDLLGEGKFSHVFKSYDQASDRLVALKVFSTKITRGYNLVAEISNMASLEHPNICSYYDAGYVQSNTATGQVTRHLAAMEYLDGGSLAPQLVTNPAMRIKLLTDVLQGLSYLHKNGIIHRDLKPQNILISNTDDCPVAKLTDFGYCKDVYLADEDTTLVMGTYAYMPPEYKPAEDDIDGNAATNYDLWSFGVIAYEMVTGVRLFGDGPEEGTYKHSIFFSNPSQELLDEEIACLPQPYQNVIARCLVKDAKERIQSADALIMILNGERPEVAEAMEFSTQAQ